MMTATILNVDDEPEIRKFLKRFLIRAGYQCHNADSTEAAMQIMANRPFETVHHQKSLGKGVPHIISTLGLHL